MIPVFQVYFFSIKFPKISPLVIHPILIFEEINQITTGYMSVNQRLTQPFMHFLQQKEELEVVVNIIDIDRQELIDKFVKQQLGNKNRSDSSSLMATTTKYFDQSTPMTLETALSIMGKLQVGREIIVETNNKYVRLLFYSL